jgi:anti-anti-sigma regulatory factor
MRARLLQIIAAEGNPPNLVLAMGAVPVVDLGGAKLLGELREELGRGGIVLRLAEVNDAVYRTLQALDLGRALAIEAPQQSLLTVLTQAGVSVGGD